MGASGVEGVGEVEGTGEVEGMGERGRGYGALCANEVRAWGVCSSEVEGIGHCALTRSGA